MDTNTITATVIDHEPVEFIFDGAETFSLPVVVGWNPDGTYQTARALAERERLDPTACDHAGATWSPCLALRCPKCGSAMFLPPRLLAYLPAATISAMDLLWSASGWAEWGTDAWRIDPNHWHIVDHHLFEQCGGLPVREDRGVQYYDALVDLAEDDHE